MKQRAALAHGTTVAVLHEAVAENSPADALDTLEQVAAVSNALSQLGLRPIDLVLPDPISKLAGAVRESGAKRVFNLVESYQGQSRFAHLPALLLEAEGVVLTGNSSNALLVSSDKLIAKACLRGHGIATPDWYSSWQFDQPDVQGTWIVKSVTEHASIGIDQDSVVPRLDAAGAIAADRKRRFGGEWFAERFIAGREFNVALLEDTDGPVVLATPEMRFSGFAADEAHIVDYAAKWDPDSHRYAGTQPDFTNLPDDGPLYQRLRAVALKCWDALGLSGYARVDFRVDDHGIPWVLEVNANPCISPDAGFARSAAAVGIPYTQLIGRITAAASGTLLRHAA